MASGWQSWRPLAETETLYVVVVVVVVVVVASGNVSFSFLFFVPFVLFFLFFFFFGPTRLFAGDTSTDGDCHQNVTERPERKKQNTKKRTK